MSTFDAGAIESRLILDRSNFTKGIKAAREQARRLDGLEIDILLNLKGLDDLVALEGLIQSMDNQNIDLDVDVSDDGLDNLAALQALVQQVDGRDIDIDVDLDGDATALARLEVLEAKVNDLDNELINIRARTSGFQESGGYMGAFRIIIYSLITLLPVFTAAIGATGGALAGLTTILVGAGAAGGVLALGIIAAIQRMEELEELGERAPQWFKDFQSSLEDMQDAWTEFSEDVSPAAFEVMASALDIVTRVLPQLVPVFDQVAAVTNQMLEDLDKYFTTDDWMESLAFIGDFGSYAFGRVLEMGGHFLDFLLELGIAFEPLARDMADGLVRIVKGWSDWAESIQGTEKLQDFMDWVNERGGQVVDMLVAFGAALINIGVALDPIAEPMLLALTAFFDHIANMDPTALGIVVAGLIGFVAVTKLLMPLISGISSLGGLAGALGLTALSPVAAVIATVAGALGGIIGILALTTDTGSKYREMWEALDSLWQQFKETAGNVWQIILDIKDALVETGVIENFQEIFANLAGTFEEILPILEPIAMLIGGVLVASLWALSEALVIVTGGMEALYDIIGPIIDWIVEKFQWLYDILLGHSIIPDIVNGTIEFFAKLPIQIPILIGKLVVAVLSLFGKLLVQGLKIWANLGLGILEKVGVNTAGIRALWDRFIGWFSGIGGRLWRFAGRWFSEIPGWAGKIIGRIEDAWDGMIGWFGRIGGRISRATGGMFNGIWQAFRSAINRVISAWNGLSFRIPGFDPPGPGSFGGVTIGTPNIGYLAEGGFVDTPVLSWVGEGSEPEAIMPLSKLYDLLEREREQITVNPDGFDNGRDYDDSRESARLAAAIEELLVEIRRMADQVPIEYNDFGQRRDPMSIAEDLWLLTKERG